MNKRIVTFCKNFLKTNIKQCSEGQILLFKRMYSCKNLNLDIDKIIDKIPDDKLSWAMEQVERTLIRNSKNIL